MSEKDLPDIPGERYPEERRRNTSPAFEARKQEVIGILTESFSRNLMDIEEFERRIELVETTGSPTALESLVSDLPASPSAVSAGFPREVRLTDELEQYTGIMSERTLKGDWLKSSRNKVFGLMSSQNFDFRDVEFPSTPVELELKTIMSEVTITVPPGVNVRLDVLPIMAECKEDRNIRRSPTDSRTPVLRITGTIFMSSVRVRQKD